MTLNIEAGTLAISVDGNYIGIAITGIVIPPGRDLRPAISIPSQAKVRFIFSNTTYGNGVEEFGGATKILTVPTSDYATLEALPIETLKIVLNNVQDTSVLALLSTNRRYALLSRTDFALWKDLFLTRWMELYPSTTEESMPIKHILDEHKSRHSRLHHWQFDEMRQATKDLFNGIFLFSSNCAYGDIYCTNVWKGPGFINPPKGDLIPDQTGIPSHTSILVHDGQRSYMRKYAGYNYPNIAFGQTMTSGKIGWTLQPRPSEVCPVAVDPLRKLVFIMHNDLRELSVNNGADGVELSRVKVSAAVNANQYGIYVQSTRRMYVILNGQICVCIDANNPRDIRLLWSQRCSYGQGGIVFTHSGAIVVSNAMQQALDPVTGRYLWESKALPHCQCLATCDRSTGLLISPSNTSSVSAIDPFTGKFAWKHELPESICFGFGSASSHPNGSVVFVSSASGQPATIFQLDSATGTEIRRFASNASHDGPRFGNSCQIFIDSHGRIYAWGSTFMCCFDEKLNLLWGREYPNMNLGTEAAFIDPVTMYIRRNNDAGGCLLK
jgi:hypothetical protein